MLAIGRWITIFTITTVIGGFCQYEQFLHYFLCTVVEYAMAQYNIFQKIDEYEDRKGKMYVLSLIVLMILCIVKQFLLKVSGH